MESGIKSQIEKYLAETYASEEYRDPKLKKIVVENVTQLLALAEQADSGDTDAFDQIKIILENIDNVLTKVHAKVVAALAIHPKEIDLMTKLDAGYEHASRNAFHLTTCQPAKDVIMAAVKNLGRDMLEKIAGFGKPTLLITPPGNLSLKIQVIDENFRIMKGQNKTDCTPRADHDLWGPDEGKMIISIVDGAPEIPKPEHITNHLSLKEIVKIYRHIFQQKGFEIMTAQEYAAGHRIPDRLLGS